MPHYTLTADAGVFSLAGQGANQAEQGVFALAGQDANFLRGYVLHALPGIFSLSGGPTVLYGVADNDFTFHDDVTEWTTTAGPARPYVLSGAVRTGDLISGSTFAEVMTEGQRCFVSVRDGLRHEWFSARFSAPNMLVPITIFRSSNKRTNEIRNSVASGAAAGSPGTAPTNWQVSASVNGLTRTIVGTGTEGGIEYIDIRWAGTPSASSLLAIQFESFTQIAAAAGQDWVGSFFATLVAGTLTNLSGVAQEVNERNIGGTIVATSSGSIALAAGGLAQNRFATARLLTDATTAWVTNRFRADYTNGQAIDFTIRIGWPQLEKGTWASSPIRTTGAAVTRDQEVNWPATGRRIVQLKNAPAKAISKLRRQTGEDGAIVRNVLNGETVTLPAGCSGVLLQPSPGTIATLTLVLPPDAEAFDTVEIITTETITGLTVNGTGADSVATGSPLTLEVGASYRYRAGNQSWYLRYSQ